MNAKFKVKHIVAVLAVLLAIVTVSVCLSSPTAKAVYVDGNSSRFKSGSGGSVTGDYNVYKNQGTRKPTTLVVGVSKNF